MNVLKISIIRGCGADQIHFEVDKPNGVFPYDGNATVEMQVAKGTAEEYLKRNFPGLTPTIIERAKYRSNFASST